jgi:lysophospholipase L1-like esterase
VFFPYLQDISEWDKERRFAESIKQRCRKYGFDVLDLLPIYKKSARKEDVYDYEKLKVRQSDICHPNALGHEVAAEAIFEKIYPLIKEGLKSK